MVDAKLDNLHQNQLYQIINTGNSKDLKKYIDIDVYFYDENKTLKLLKSIDQDWRNASIIDNDGNPIDLFIKFHDRVAFIRKKQNNLNLEIKKSVTVNIPKAKKLLIELVDVTLAEPRADILKGMKDTVNMMVEEYLKNPQIVEHLVRTSMHDYSTSLHLTNCMLFCFGFGNYVGYDEDQIKELGLIGLMHDIGKIEIPDYILQAQRKLSTEEFALIKEHPKHSYKMLKKSGFDEIIAKASVEHHEKLDGSGYPYGKNTLDEKSKIIAIIDIFEALTNWRPYKKQMPVLQALKIMRDEEMLVGKIDKELFKTFANSLVGIKVSSKKDLSQL